VRGATPLVVMVTGSNERPMEPVGRDQDLAAAGLTSHHARRAADGDVSSLTWLVERLSPLLIAQVQFRLGPSLRRIYDPEDLVQDAWLIALPWMSTMQAPNGRYTPVLLKFLSSTLVHRVQNLVRKHIQGKPQVQPMPGDASGATPEPAAQQSGAITQAVRSEHRELIYDALQRLRDVDRQVIVLRGIEQLPSRTVGAMLGLTREAVAMRYRRALGSLQARLPGSVFAELSVSESDS